MGANLDLTGDTIASTYVQLLHTGATEGVEAGATAHFLADGNGTQSALSISTTRVGIGIEAPAVPLHIDADGATDGIVLKACGEYEDASAGILIQNNFQGTSSTDETASITFVVGNNSCRMDAYKIDDGDDSDARDTGFRFYPQNGNNTSQLGLELNHEGALRIGGGATYVDISVNSTILIVQDGNVDGLVIRNADNAGDSNNRLIDLDFSADDDCTGAYFIRMQDSGSEIGSIKVANATTVAFNTSSDYRFKEDFKDIVDATGTINKLKLYNFKWKKSETRSDGIIAHEAAEVYPQPIDGEKDAMTTKEYADGIDEKGNAIWKEKAAILPQLVDYSKFVPLLLKSIQELSAKVTALENA